MNITRCCFPGHQGGAGGRHHDCGGHGGAGQGGDPHGGLRQVAQVGRRQGEGDHSAGAWSELHTRLCSDGFVTVEQAPDSQFDSVHPGHLVTAPPELSGTRWENCPWP